MITTSYADAFLNIVNIISANRFHLLTYFDVAISSTPVFFNAFANTNACVGGLLPDCANNPTIRIRLLIGKFLFFVQHVNRYCCKYITHYGSIGTHSRV